MKKLIAIITTVFLVSTQVHAGDIECIGKIDTVMTTAEGWVAIVSSNMFGDTAGRTICNIQTASPAVNGTSIEVNACKNWSSQLIASYASKTNTKIIYNSGSLTLPFTSCSTTPVWNLNVLPNAIANWP